MKILATLIFILTAGIGIVKSQNSPIGVKDILPLMKKKQEHAASGEIVFFSKQTEISETIASELEKECIDMMENLSFSGKSEKLHASLEKVADLLKSSGIEFETSLSTLRYAGNKFYWRRELPVNEKNKVFLDKTKENIKEFVVEQSYIDGLHSYLDPFSNTLNVEERADQYGLSGESLLALDLTFVNYTNLLTEIPERKISLYKTDTGFSIKTQITENGFEKQNYVVRDNFPYIKNIEALMGENGTSVKKYFAGYVPMDGGKKKETIYRPSLVAEITRLKNGEIFLKLFEVKKWDLKKFETNDFVIKPNPKTKIK